MKSADDADACVAAALRNPSALFPDGHDVPAWIEAACRHRVFLLLGRMISEASAFDRWPAEFVEVCQQSERRAIATECIREKELARLLADLAAAGLHVLLIKGAAIAHTHYPAPHLRVRADTDLLVPESGVAVLEQVVARTGYTRPVETSGRLVSYQSHYQKTDEFGVTHALDVHWKISNLQSLADRMSHEELWERRVPLAALGAAAFTIDPASALLLALLHRAGHHPGSRNLLWTYDLHLLAGALTPIERRQVLEEAVDRGLARIAIDGLTLARDMFGGVAVETLLAGLLSANWRDDDVRLIGESFTQAGVLGRDLAALPTWRARVRLLREHVLPAAGYMRDRYGVRSNTLLPALYLWRLLHGVPRWLLPRARES